MTEKVELEKLSPEEFSKLEVELGSKVRDICDKACAEANALLSIYGLRTKMQIVIDQEESMKDLS